jgi:argininosuccinate lyase
VYGQFVGSGQPLLDTGTRRYLSRQSPAKILADPAHMPFSAEYVRLVLADHFEDAKTLFLIPLFDIHYAHLVMLAETGIISREDARAIRRALDGTDLEVLRASVYDSRSEDLFFHVDRLLLAAAGPDAAGRLHTARSRNDIDMTMYRMRLRDDLLAVLGALGDLRRVLLALASRHRETVFPAHTHTQPAQPTTLAHYLLGAIEERERDAARCASAYGRVNRCPLGACAITGTGFAIDRPRTADLLGFEGPTGNTYGSIASMDVLLEACAAVGVAVAGLGRFVQDMLLWCTSEVGYLRLPDDLVQVSSIMPQKRNPVALEHARAILSRALGQVQAVPLAVHNTPFGDIVDTEDDLQPLVARALRDAVRGVRLVATALERSEFDVARMRDRAHTGWVALTELADTLARDRGVPFATAHAIAARLVDASPHGSAAEAPAVVLQRAAAALGHPGIQMSDAELARVLSPDHFVRIRRTPGGPAPEVTGAAIEASRARLDADTQLTATLQDALTQAGNRRRAAVAAL